jgi:hypothetical protein
MAPSRDAASRSDSWADCEQPLEYLFFEPSQKSGSSSEQVTGIA